MTRYRLDKAAIALGAGAVVAALLGLVLKFRSNTRGEGKEAGLSTFADLTTTAVIVLLALGAVAVAGGLLGSRIGQLLAAAAGLGMLVVAAAQPAKDLFGWFDWLSVGRGPMAMLGGFALGLLAVALTPRAET